MYSATVASLLLLSTCAHVTRAEQQEAAIQSDLVSAGLAKVKANCTDATYSYNRALRTVQTCRETAECQPARPLIGTSCGCTRNLLASIRANDAEMAEYSKTKDNLVKCFGEGMFETPCDCPVATAQCVAGKCAYSSSVSSAASGAAAAVVDKQASVQSDLVSAGLAKPKVNCTDIPYSYRRALRTVQTCRETAECQPARPLIGTSCGCTRNLLASIRANDAEMAEYSRQKDSLVKCFGEGMFETPCDCPAATAQCVAGKCAYSSSVSSSASGAAAAVVAKEASVQSDLVSAGLAKLKVNCTDIPYSYRRALRTVQTCRETAECQPARPLIGTSCGCTRNLLASIRANDAEMAEYSKTKDNLVKCFGDGMFVTTCDCPVATAQCVAGKCAYSSSVSSAASGAAAAVVDKQASVQSDLVSAGLAKPKVNCTDIPYSYRRALRTVQTCRETAECQPARPLIGTSCGCTRNLLASIRANDAEMAEYSKQKDFLVKCFGDGMFVTTCDCPAATAQCVAGKCAYSSSVSSSASGAVAAVVAKEASVQSDLVSAGLAKPKVNCTDIPYSYKRALSTVQTCRETAECQPARPLIGTSCGCTRNLLASIRANDAEMAEYSKQKDFLVKCFGDGMFVTTCDCPAATAQCVAGKCAYSSSVSSSASGAVAAVVAKEASVQSDLVSAGLAKPKVNCTDIPYSYRRALRTVQTCRETAECQPARPLIGTSCGCTRNLLASIRANDAEMAEYSKQKDFLVKCFGDGMFVTTCDCPAATAQCVAGKCAYSSSVSSSASGAAAAVVAKEASVQSDLVSAGLAKPKVNCTDIPYSYRRALRTVQTCRETAECQPARPLIGTSCGCTRNLLASIRANDAEMAEYSKQKDFLVKCFGDGMFVTTCDCPAATAQCVAGKCAYSGVFDL